MGAAAYNRGSRAVSAKIDATLPSAELVLLRALTDYSERNDGDTLLGPTVIRYTPSEKRGLFYVMNRQDKGWSSYAEAHGSLWTVARRYRLAFVGMGRDEHSHFYRVTPLAPRASH